MGYERAVEICLCAGDNRNNSYCDVAGSLIARLPLTRGVDVVWLLMGVNLTGLRWGFIHHQAGGQGGKTKSRGLENCIANIEILRIGMTLSVVLRRGW